MIIGVFLGVSAVLCVLLILDYLGVFAKRVFTKNVKKKDALNNEVRYDTILKHFERTKLAG